MPDIRPHGALWPLPDGGTWEGGTTDRHGNRWVHVPHKGWQLASPLPFFRNPPGSGVHTGEDR